MSDVISNLWDGLRKDLTEDANADLFALSTVPHGIPTGQPQLDLCIGRDGIPVGRVIEFFGFERSGKTTSALHIAGQVQKRGGIVLFIDTENTFEWDRAVECGCEKDSTFNVATAQSVDSIFRVAYKFLDQLEKIGWQKDALIIVDSVTAVECEFNLEREFGTIPRAAEDARTIRSGMRRLVPKLAKLKVPAIFINHAIENPAAMFGKKSKAAGGHSIKFSASLRVEFTHLGELKDKEKARTGQKIKVRIEKIKGAHLKRTEYDTELLNIEGFNYPDQLLGASISAGIMTKSGAGAGTKYNLLDSGTEDAVQSFSKAEFERWVQATGRDETYEWFLKSSEAAGEIVPWSASRLG